MSADRELLEAAAKAARMTLGAWSERRLAFMYRDASPGPGYWNPLTDDGDALRLAVKLGIDVIQTNIHSPQVHALADAGARVWEDSSADPFAATRRAIVRAAAEIGRSMK